MKQKKVDFEINLTKMKWCPKHVSEVPEIISRAFERDIPMRQISPVIGTDHVKQWVLKEDKDIPEFYNAPTMMQEWIAEKVIKVRIPDGIMPKGFQPKKCKILATGQKIAKFFGEDTVSTRTVEGTLKLFDCNHFYLKQTLPGSGASPHWTIFEGRWQSTERGLRLEYLLRYSWQLSRKPYIEFAVEAVRSDLVTTLAWEGEAEKQLNGNLPAIVGTDDFFWAELVREGSTTEAKIRWNEDCPDPVSWRGRPDPKPPADPKPHAEPQPPPKPASPQEQPPRSSAAEGPSLHQRRPVAAPPAPPEPAPAARPGARAQAAPEPAPPEVEDTESALPLYIGFALFVAMAAAFAYFTWEERS